MTDLVAFLRARLDEDEAAAKAAREEWTAEWVGYEWNDLPDAVYAHAHVHDPKRALREVEAKRAILGRHTPHDTAFDGLACDWCSEDVDDRPQLAKERWPCGDVRDLAAVYADHPDYKETWKP